MEYVIIIIVSTIIDYFLAILIARQTTRKKRRKFLIISLISNLGLLFTFKYVNFFNDSIREVFNLINISYNIPAFKLLLPVGISFYTFQSLSYTIDVYRGQRNPEIHFGIFALYISFFPQLVAGPIGRSSQLIPQFYKNNTFDYERLVSGLKQILWGFFKKLVIADRVAIYVNAVYNNQINHSGITLLFATILFAIQIYCDFSGYSDIAIGSARILGYDLMENFRRPYFSKSLNEFWKRWHISLSTWFRDYVYISLGGNRVVKWRWYYNLFITFLISGLWHGANLTFIFWGLIHGTLVILEIWTEKFRGFITQCLKKLKLEIILSILEISITFCLVCFAWIFFRANTITDAMNIIFKIIQFDTSLYIGKGYFLAYSLIGIVILLLVEFKLEGYSFGFALLYHKNRIVSLFSCIFLILTILTIGVFDGGQFIYFQF